MTPIIQLHNVSKTYIVNRQKIAALKDITLSIMPGEFVAITGPSGSGKTTLAQVIGGLARATTGTVQVNGQQINSLGDRAISAFRNKNIGFVFQNFGLLPHYTALENVMIPLYVAEYSTAERRQKARFYLETVGLSTQASRLSNTLSGGQRQRVAIARALAMQPTIIIADEPTGNLDSKHGQRITDTLKKLTRDNAITAIMVTHDQTLAKQTDRQIHLKDGALI